MKKSVLPIVLSFLCAIFFSYAGNAIGAAQNDKPAWKLQQNDGEKAYDPSTILVKFKKGVAKKQRNALASLAGGKFKDKNEDGIDDRYQHILSGRLALIELKGKKGLNLASRALLALQNHPLIEYAEYNYLQYIDLTPNDPRFGELWGLHNTGQPGGTDDADIDAPEAWDISTGSSEVIVGVIDTGIDYNHVDLATNIWVNPGEIPGNGLDDDGNGYVDDIHGINAITGSGDPMDDHYHGTHCAGTIGAVGDNHIGVVGVNSTVKIIGIKFLDSGGSGWTSDAVESVHYAVALKNRENDPVNIRVLSNSWGGGGFSQSLLDAINAANDEDILFVAAAGNYSSNNDSSPYYPSSYDNANVVAVASTDRNDNLSSFSNYGFESVDLAAPGSSILSTFPGNAYAYLSGTSMATPHVSGAAALLLSVNDLLTVQELKDYLMDYGDPLPALNGMCVSEMRLNVYNSLSQVPPAAPTFRLSADPTDQTVTQGETAAYTINIQSVLEFSDPVDLSADSNPAINATITFSHNPDTPESSWIMDVVTTTATEATDPGDYIINVTGVSGDITKTTTVTLTVEPEGLTTVSYTNNPGISIPDNNPAGGITSTIYVPDSLDVWNTACVVNITHTWIGDLIVKLTSPSGTEVILHNRTGGSANDIYRTYEPAEFRDEEGQGNWTLLVSDNAYLDLGTLDSWTLTIDGFPTGPVNQAPTVTIDMPSDGSSFDVGTPVTFTGSADDPESSDISSAIEWTSSIDGNIGSGASVPESVLSVGTHTITATAIDSDGMSGSDSITVTINPLPSTNDPPTANFTFDKAKLMVRFTDHSTDGDGTIVSWSWNFGDGKTGHAKNPKHKYRRNGTYTVTLTVTDDGGATDSISRDVIVTK
jgi:subtilisin-like proprotein convertase family protein